MPNGPLRPLVVRTVLLRNCLELATGWLLDVWLELPWRVRKALSEYGALQSSHVLWSGYDPTNAIYAFALGLCCYEHLPPDHAVFVNGLNAETLGDICEGVLGYWWWMRFRPEAAEWSLERCSRQLIRDWPAWEQWLEPQHKEIIWRLLRQQLDVESDGLALSLHELVECCEELEMHRPDLFRRPWRMDEWNRRFDELRLRG